MQKIAKLCLVCLLFFSAGCSWLALLDTSYSSHDYECDNKVHKELKSEAEALEYQLFGLSKDQVILKLGKPKPKNIKYGNYSYVVDRDCVGKNCETKLADEVWYYEFEKKLPSCGRYSYSMMIYFVNNKVARVGNW